MQGADQCRARCAGLAFQGIENIGCEAWIELGDRLVGENDFRRRDKRTGDRDALAFSSRQATHLFLGQTPNTESIKELTALLSISLPEAEERSPRRALPEKPAENICLDRAIRIEAQMLKNDADPSAKVRGGVGAISPATVGNPARRRWKKPGETREKAALSNSRRTDNRHEASARNLDTQIAHQLTAFACDAEALG